MNLEAIKQISLGVFSFAVVLVVCLTFLKGCETTTIGRLKCIEMTQKPAECELSFRN